MHSSADGFRRLGGRVSVVDALECSTHCATGRGWTTHENFGALHRRRFEVDTRSSSTLSLNWRHGLLPAKSPEQGFEQQNQPVSVRELQNDESDPSTEQLNHSG